MLWRWREINTESGDSGTWQEGSWHSQGVNAKSSINSCLRNSVCEQFNVITSSLTVSSCPSEPEERNARRRAAVVEQGKEHPGQSRQ